MQIILNIRALKDCAKAKEIGKAKLTVLYHEDDVMTVEEHLAIEKMRAKPEFMLSEFDDSEIGWSMTAGSLLSEYPECVLVTDVESLLEKNIIKTRDGKKTLYFAKDIQNALRLSAMYDKKAARKARVQVSKHQKEEKGDEKSADKTSDGFPMPEPVSPEIKDMEEVLSKPKPKGVYTPDDFKKEIIGKGIDENESEAIRNALLDAETAEDLARLLSGRVADPESISKMLKDSFKELKERAKEAEINFL